MIVAADAVADFDDAFSYLRRDAGARVARRFNVTLKRLLKFPESGAPRPMLGQNARVAIVSRYILIYDYVRENDVIFCSSTARAAKHHTRTLAPQMTRGAVGAKRSPRE